MYYLLTVALLFFQTGPGDPPDPLDGGAKPAATKAGGNSVDDLLKEPGAKPAAPAGDAGTIGKPADFKPAGPAGAAAPAEGAAPAAALRMKQTSRASTTGTMSFAPK